MTPEEKIDRILQEDLPLTQEILALNRKMRAETAIKRNELREMYGKFEAEMDSLMARRGEIRRKILALWERHFPKEVTIDLPSAMVSRRNKAELKVHDANALLIPIDDTHDHTIG